MGACRGGPGLGVRIKTLFPKPNPAPDASTAPGAQWAPTLSQHSGRPEAYRLWLSDSFRAQVMGPKA